MNEAKPLNEARRKGLVLDGPDIWAQQLWQLWGSMTNGPLEDEPWWQEWQRVRAEIERPLRATLSAAESRIQELEAHVGRLQEALEQIALIADGQATLDDDKAFALILPLAEKVLSSTPAESLESLRQLKAITRELLAAFLFCHKFVPLTSAEVYHPDELRAEALSLLDAEARKVSDS